MAPNREPGLVRWEQRALERPDGVARIFWRRYWRALRLAIRAEDAQIDHDVMYGRPDAAPVRGILESEPL